jgi:uncharacterized protein YegP (UPF0339 family)
VKRSWYVEIYNSPWSYNWYWRLKAGNGRIVADSSEGYASLGNCKRAVNVLLENMRGPIYVIVVQEKD